MAGYDVRSKEEIITNKIVFFKIRRKKAHIYINYVHQLTTIHANRWPSVLVLNQLERI